MPLPSLHQRAHPLTPTSFCCPFCGWRLLHLRLGGEQPVKRNDDSHLLFRVLLGSVAVKFCSNFIGPPMKEARPSDMFVLHPFNYLSLRKPSAVLV
jgi:hypothetical protein